MSHAAPSRLAGAFVSLANAKALASGKRLGATIGRTYCPNAIIGSISGADIFLAGGEGQSGSVSISVPVTDLGVEPKKFTPVKFEGSAKGLQVLSVAPVNGVTFDLICGDPTSDQR